MKINSINIYNLQNQTKVKKTYSQCLQYKKDSISFGAKKPITNFFKKIFKKTLIPQVACYTPREDASNLSDEEIKSEEIKKFIGTTIASYGGLIEQGRSTYNEIEEMLQLGRIQNYKGTIEYNPDDNANIVFGKINSETNLPSTISLWRDGEFMYSYEISSSNPLEYQLTVQDGNIDTIQAGVKNKITMLSQTDKKFKTIKQFDVQGSGFNYLYGKLKNDGNVEIKKRLYFDFSNIKGCIYAEGTPDGIALYLYNQDIDLWEQKYLLEFDKQ